MILSAGSLDSLADLGYRPLALVRFRLEMLPLCYHVSFFPTFLIQAHLQMSFSVLTLNIWTSVTPIFQIWKSVTPIFQIWTSVTPIFQIWKSVTPIFQIWISVAPFSPIWRIGTRRKSNASTYFPKACHPCSLYCILSSPFYFGARWYGSEAFILEMHWFYYFLCIYSFYNLVSSIYLWIFTLYCHGAVTNVIRTLNKRCIRRACYFVSHFIVERWSLLRHPIVVSFPLACDTASLQLQRL